MGAGVAVPLGGELALAIEADVVLAPLASPVEAPPPPPPPQAVSNAEPKTAKAGTATDGA